MEFDDFSLFKFRVGRTQRFFVPDPPKSLLHTLAILGKPFDPPDGIWLAANPPSPARKPLTRGTSKPDKAGWDMSFALPHQGVLGLTATK